MSTTGSIRSLGASAEDNVLATLDKAQRAHQHKDLWLRHTGFMKKEEDLITAEIKAISTFLNTTFYRITSQINKQLLKTKHCKENSMGQSECNFFGTPSWLNFKVDYCGITETCDIEQRPWLNMKRATVGWHGACQASGRPISCCFCRSIQLTA